MCDLAQCGRISACGQGVLGSIIDNPPSHCLDVCVTVRQFAVTVASALVAIGVALAVPVSQLQIRTVVTTCCCPDPSHCHCPDHKGTPDGGSSMRACHKTQHELVSAGAPSFAAPAVAIIDLPEHGAHVATPLVSSPPKTPPVPEPTGPS
jgi:hypothetical protein